MYSLPDSPPPVLVSALGPKAVSLAARIGDGYISTSPDSEALDSYLEQGGKGLKQGGMKVCWASTKRPPARPPTSCGPTPCCPGSCPRSWPCPASSSRPELVTEEQLAETIPCGPDPERHLESRGQYIEAGFDEVYVSQIGDDQAGFFEFYSPGAGPAALPILLRGLLLGGGAPGPAGRTRGRRTRPRPPRPSAGPGRW